DLAIGGGTGGFRTVHERHPVLLLRREMGGRADSASGAVAEAPRVIRSRWRRHRIPELPAEYLLTPLPRRVRVITRELRMRDEAGTNLAGRGGAPACTRLPFRGFPGCHGCVP